MFKLRKEKLLVSLIVVLMIALTVGNITSLATAPQITATIGGNTNKNSINSALSSNNTVNVGASEAVSADVNNTSNKTNTNKTNSNKTNTNRVSSSLPYAGTNGTVVFVVIALAASAIYAYKKVSDYNI